jgi:3-oxoacyl-[acyl-carrier-protein] synthase II
LISGGEVLAPETVPHTVAREFGVQGPVMNLSSACATGVQSVMVAAGWIRDGRCERVLAGASESSLHPLYLAGFRKMGVLSEAGRVRPFDKRRDGFVMGEGAGVFFLESLASARRRGARVYAELAGWAFGCDAHHATRFNSNGRRMADTLVRALRAAGAPAESLGYVNAHGTGTVLNDALETQALVSLFPGKSPLVSSTKGATGHLLGATGAVELAFSLLALRDGRVPPTLNMEEPETDRLDFVPNRSRAADVRRVASLSFGFGGSLAAVVAEKA